MLLVHQMDHLLSADCESSAGGNGRGRCQTGPTTVASDSSPTKSPAERSAIVASFPPAETTVTVARPGLKSPSSNSGYNQEPRTLGFGEGNRFVGV